MSHIETTDDEFDAVLNALKPESYWSRIVRSFDFHGRRRFIHQKDVLGLTTSICENNFTLNLPGSLSRALPEITSRQKFAYAVRKGEDQFELHNVQRDITRSKHPDYIWNEQDVSIEVLNTNDTLHRLSDLQAQFTSAADIVLPARFAPKGCLHIEAFKHIDQHVGTYTRMLEARLETL